MKIAGFEKVSFIEYPGKSSSIVFTQGCNFKCVYCHNFELIPVEEKGKIKEDEIFDYLKEREGLIDAVTITGGEPTLQSDLIEFLKKIKEKKLLIKLDSNGTNPEMLKKIIDEKLVDYIAMDIKTSLENYEKIIQNSINEENVKKSIKMIIDFGNYEFRTTIYPSLVTSDFHKIGELIKGADNYYLQQFRNEHTLAAGDAEPYSEEKLKEFQEIMKKYVKKVEIRGL